MAGFLMDNGQPFKWLPRNPYLKQFWQEKIFFGRKKLLSKIVLGIFFISFFLLDYQPAFSFPPIKKKAPTHAQEELKQAQQIQTINSQSLPIGFTLPHPGYLSTTFSYYHPGIDLATGLGMPIKPIAKGTIKESGYNFWGLGLVVEVDHGYGYSSLYAHMGKTYVQKGQQVSENDFIGEVGLTGHTTGPHTHLEVSKEDKKIDPLTILPPVRNNPLAEDFVSPVATSSATQKTAFNYNNYQPVLPKVELIQPEKKLDLTNQIRQSL